ncbi:hypothetical protein, partial [Gracilinema caldarium]|uniref:hypothetical protein n=1 Tax=Gracilinema caldarium TaxID=215591 RepID=UPI0026EAE32E
MIETLRITVSEIADIGHARRRAIDFCNTLMIPFSEEDRGNVAILVTELTTNIKKHAESGQIIMHPIYIGDKTGLQLFAIDHGPGFPAGTHFLQDGTSTVGTLGIGLGGIQRISKNFDFITIPGLGVILACQYWPSHFWKEDLFGQIEIGGINVPIPNEELSGDCWTIEPLGNRYRVFLADG